MVYPRVLPTKVKGLYGYFSVPVVFFFSLAINAQQTVLVHSIQEFNTAVSEAKPGTNIVLANGVWQDAELLFEGEGSVSKPIKLSVEEKGKVTLEGQSYLQIAGSYLSLIHI